MDQRQVKAIVEHFCLRDSLSTYDPYDIWKTGFGFQVKALFNQNRYVALPLAAFLTIADNFLINSSRWGYLQQEYPIVRAFAALTLLNLYRNKSDQRYLDFARKHLLWLTENACTGYSGLCWGLGFDYAVGKGYSYSKNMPLSTMTPYPLEAFLTYRTIARNNEFDDAIASIYKFFNDDILVMEETDQYLITSYAAMEDRVVINAVSYCMYAHALLLPHTPSCEKDRILEKIYKMYQYVRGSQNADGSWLYSPNGKSFIDCFHSCMVLKNIFKTDRIVPLAEASSVVAAGYSYLMTHLYDSKENLFKRFSLSNKPSLVKYDLYDNAEVLNLAILLNDKALAADLQDAIEKNFIDGGDIYSYIDCFGIRRNRNTLRWAVMPYLFALSQMQGL